MDNDARHLNDFHLCHECLEGKSSAIEALQKEFGVVTSSFLMGSGARAQEAREVVDGLWADLLAPVEGGVPRLSRYDGSCALQTWLNTVALNLLLTRKRKESRWNKLVDRLDAPAREGEVGTESMAGRLADASPDEATEAPIIEIIRIAVETAFNTCDPEDFVLLQLRYCDGLLGAELGRMFGCHESKISRRIDKAEEIIAAATIEKIRESDPWLELKWTDFLDLCRTARPSCFGFD